MLKLSNFHLLPSTQENSYIDPDSTNEKTKVKVLLFGLEDPVSVLLHPDILNASRITMVLPSFDEHKLNIIYILIKLNKTTLIDIFTNQFNIKFSKLPKSINSVSSLDYFNQSSKIYAGWRVIDSKKDSQNMTMTETETLKPLPKIIYINNKGVKVFHLLVQGSSYVDISKHLKMSVDTVRYYIKSLYNKLGVNTKSAVILMHTKGEIIVRKKK